MPPRAAWVTGGLSVPLVLAAFPGVGWWPLGLVALAPLVVAVRGQPPRRALLLGWAAGLAMVLVGFRWLVGTLHAFAGWPLAACVAATAALAVVQSARFGIFTWLAARGERHGWPFPPIAILAFATSELVAPALLPWSYAAIAHATPVLMQTAEWGGPTAVSVVLVSVNVAVAELFVAWRRQGPWRRAARWPAALFALVAGAVTWSAWRIAAVDVRVAAAPGATVGLVQANIAPEAKRADWRAALGEHLRLTRELVRHASPDLVVWSETNLPAAIPASELDAEVFRQVGGRLRAPTVVGAVVAEGDRRFNSALLVGAKGDVAARYDKQRLLPFAERPVLGDLLGRVAGLGPRVGHFSPGPERAPLRFGEHQLATTICSEDVLPELVADVVAAGEPDLLVNISNDAWFGSAAQAEIHMALASFRAIEHRRFLVRSSNSGVSAIVDPVGRVLARTRPYQQETLIGRVRWLRGRTPFERVGRAPWWIAALVSGLAALVPSTASPSPRTRRRRAG